MTNDILQCALGVHRFDKQIEHYFLCSICERAKHYKDPSGYEQWYGYDEKGNMIHYKNSNGYECWTEYDEKGNMIHHGDSSGYNEQTRGTGMKNNDLLQCALGVHRYDKKIGENWFCCSICERARYYKYPSGNESWYEYDEKGNEIHSRKSKE